MHSDEGPLPEMGEWHYDAGGMMQDGPPFGSDSWKAKRDAELETWRAKVAAQAEAAAANTDPEGRARRRATAKAKAEASVRAAAKARDKTRGKSIAMAIAKTRSKGIAGSYGIAKHALFTGLGCALMSARSAIAVQEAELRDFCFYNQTVSDEEFPF